MSLGHILGWINSRLILSLIFVVILIPLAFIMKTFGYDPMRQKTINKKTYRELKKYKNNLNKIF